MNKIANFFIAVLAMATLTGAAGIWTINLTSDGAISSLTFENVMSSLGIERSFEVDVNSAGNPVMGTVTFYGGFRRFLTESETNLVWEVYGGRQVMWEYLKSQGRVLTVAPDQTPIPGKMAYLITRDDVEYFGVVAFGARSDFFVLYNEGNAITFDGAPLKVFEQVRPVAGESRQAMKESYLLAQFGPVP
jgi:hypothetical protein